MTERTFRIQWADDRAEDVTGDLDSAIRHAQAAIGPEGDAIEWYDPLVIVDLATGREYRIPAATLLSHDATRALAATANARVGALYATDLQGIQTAHAAILRHLEGYTDADLRQAAARLSDISRRVTSEAQAAPTAALTRGQRADVVTARGTLQRIAGGNDADPDTAASMLDRVLATTCPHDASEHHTAPDVMTGRPLTTCYGCGVTWYADFPERLAHVTSYAGGEG